MYDPFSFTSATDVDWQNDSCGFFLHQNKEQSFLTEERNKNWEKETDINSDRSFSVHTKHSVSQTFCKHYIASRGINPSTVPTLSTCSFRHRALMKMDTDLLHSPALGLTEEEEADMNDWKLPLAFMKKRHLEKIEGSKALAQSWRMKDRVCLPVQALYVHMCWVFPCAELLFFSVASIYLMSLRSDEFSGNSLIAKHPYNLFDIFCNLMRD